MLARHKTLGSQALGTDEFPSGDAECQTIFLGVPRAHRLETPHALASQALGTDEFPTGDA